MSNRKAVKFYKSYYEVAKELPKKVRGEFIEAILDFQFEGKEPNFKGILKLAWISQKHSLDKQMSGYEHGVKGGAPPKGTHNLPPKGTSNQEQEKDKEKEQEEVKEKVKVTSRFTPPSFLEVKNYISEKGYSVSPDAFIAFYESNGWKVGKNKMKDWKAAIRTWQNRNKEKSSGKKESESIMEKLSRI